MEPSEDKHGEREPFCEEEPFSPSIDDYVINKASSQNESYCELELDNYCNKLDNVSTSIDSAALYDADEVRDSKNPKDLVHIFKDKEPIAEFTESENLSKKRRVSSAFSTDREEPCQASKQLKKSTSRPGSSIFCETEKDADIKSVRDVMFEHGKETMKGETSPTDNMSKEDMTSSLAQSGLLSLTLKTAQLLKEQEALNKEIATLKFMTQQHIRQVLSNPENAPLRQRLLTLKKEFFSNAETK